MIRFLGDASSLTHGSKTAITIGKFDGLHTGHRALINNLLVCANAHNLTPMVLILEPHPHEHFTKQSHPRLMSMRMKYRALHALGIKRVGALMFRQAANLSPNDFINKILLQQCFCVQLTVGEDFRFGHKQRGSIDDLRQHNDAFITSVVASKHTPDGQTISSSHIKHLLSTGAITQANQLLGSQYVIEGRVVRGQQRGRALGFPTANLHTKIITPLAGVYYGYAHYNSKQRQEDISAQAVANIGTNPTFESRGGQRVEVHLLDCAENLYGQRVRFTPLGRIRPEKRYPNPEALQAAIQQDIAAARCLLK